LVDQELKRVEREMVIPLHVAVEINCGKVLEDIKSVMRRKGTLEEDGPNPRYVGFDCIYSSGVRGGTYNLKVSSPSRIPCDFCKLWIRIFTCSMSKFTVIHYRS
jgi:hypothetical protein